MVQSGGRAPCSVFGLGVRDSRAEVVERDADDRESGVCALWQWLVEEVDAKQLSGWGKA